MRKELIKSASSSAPPVSDGLDIGAIAIVQVSSEMAGHPVENAFDGQSGPGASRWISETGGEHTLILAFDGPQAIHTLGLEIEETEEKRTQELEVSVSRDGGKMYREFVRQEFNFSPEGATFEREEWALNVEGITHLRLRIKPDKSGRLCRASITSLFLR